MGRSSRSSGLGGSPGTRHLCAPAEIQRHLRFRKTEISRLPGVCRHCLVIGVSCLLSRVGPDPAQTFPWVTAAQDGPPSVTARMATLTGSLLWFHLIWATFFFLKETILRMYSFSSVRLRG